MKKYLLILGLLLYTGVIFAQDKQAILKVMADQQFAWNNGDINSFMQGYWKSDSLLFVGVKQTKARRL